LAVAKELKIPVETHLYLKQPLDRAALEDLVSKLEDPVEDLVRKDAKFKKLELDPAPLVGKPKAVVKLLSEHMALMQRPVLVKGNKAIIGRPKDRIAAFLKG